MTHESLGGAESLLRRHSLFASEDVDEIRVRVGAALNDHRLEPGGSALAARFYRLKSHALSICLLEYGEAVTIETQPADDFLLVQTAISGTVGVACKEGHWTVTPGRSVVLPSEEPLRLEWTAGSTQMLLKMPLARLHEVYDDLTGAHASRPPRFDRQIALDSVDGRQWSALMGYLCEQVADPSPMTMLKARLTEEALIRHLLCMQSVSVREHLDNQPAKLASKHLRRAREFMEASLQQDVSLQDIADHAGASVRNLSRAFQAHYGLGPMQVLRAMRLDRIRDELRCAPAEASVSEVALNWGCSHLGRFAAAYRARFGEAPRETLLSSRRRLQ